MADLRATPWRDPAGELTAAELRELGRLLAEPAVWAVPGEGLSERVVAAIGAAAADSGSAPPRGAAPVTPVGPVARLPRRRSSRRRRYAAAAVVTGLGLSAALSGDRRPGPIQFAVALHGTALAPGASGHATISRTGSGWEIYLEATGLPRRSGQTYYEAWLRNPDGVLVPIGTFNQPSEVRLWAGVTPVDFPVLTVTRQQVGDQASSGQVVAIGTAAPRS